MKELNYLFSTSTRSESTSSSKGISRKPITFELLKLLIGVTGRLRVRVAKQWHETGIHHWFNMVRAQLSQQPSFVYGLVQLVHMVLCIDSTGTIKGNNTYDDGPYVSIIVTIDMFFSKCSLDETPKLKNLVKRTKNNRKLLILIEVRSHGTCAKCPCWSLHSRCDFSQTRKFKKFIFALDSQPLIFFHCWKSPLYAFIFAFPVVNRPPLKW